MNETKIEWTEFSWNPVTGCNNNCYYCYAKAIYDRYKWSFEPTFKPDRLKQPTKLKKPQLIFVCSVADLFGDWIPESWIKEVINVIKKCPQHTFQFLTKNPKRYSEFVFPKNCWLGATATNQEMFDIAINYLKNIKNITFISCEPLLSPIFGSLDKIDWLIIGACTGKYRFQPPKDWVERLTKCGQNSNCAIFYKPNLTGYIKYFREYPKVIHDSQQLILQ